MNENVLKAADLATIANWILIIGVALLMLIKVSPKRTKNRKA